MVNKKEEYELRKFVNLGLKLNSVTICVTKRHDQNTLPTTSSNCSAVLKDNEISVCLVPGTVKVIHKCKFISFDMSTFCLL